MRCSTLHFCMCIFTFSGQIPRGFKHRQHELNLNLVTHYLKKLILFVMYVNVSVYSKSQGWYVLTQK